MKGRVRLDKLLVERGLESSRERAAVRIEAGEVLVAGMVVNRPASMVDPGADVALSGEAMRYVSRGGLKLEQALDEFALDVTGRVVIDVGASTGGFTDCVLQRGAARVFAVDVGHGQLAWKLRSDSRVVVLERSNIRTMPPELVTEKAGLAVIDCSFIGLMKVLPAALGHLLPGADIVALVKPQFEVGPRHVGKGGVVRDEHARAESIEAVRADAARLGLEVLGGVDCATHGPNGNVEYLLWLRVPLSGPALPSA